METLTKQQLFNNFITEGGKVKFEVEVEGDHFEREDVEGTLDTDDLAVNFLMDGEGYYNETGDGYNEPVEAEYGFKTLWVHSIEVYDRDGDLLSLNKKEVNELAEIIESKVEIEFLN